jgi:hypothetical protein
MIKKFNELNSEETSVQGNFKVVFEGFKSKEDAIRFAQWYEGSGEQNASDDLDIDLTVDMQEFHKRGGFKSNENGEVIVPLKNYNK